MNPVYVNAKREVDFYLKKYGTAMSIESADQDTMAGSGVLLDSEQDSVTNQGETKKLLFAPFKNSFRPVAGDIVDAAGTAWAITSVEDINPDGQTLILYKMLVAK